MLSRSERRIPTLLIVLYAAFLSGFFVIPNAVDHYKMFLYAVLPLSLLPAKAMLGDLVRSRLFWLITGYLLYMVLSSLWSEPFDTRQFYKTLTLAVCVLSFVWFTAWFFQQPGADRAWRIVWVVACVNAVVSACYWYVYLGEPFPGSRLISIGPIENPNPVGFVYALFALIGVYFLINCKTRLWQFATAAGVAVLVAATLFTQSRNALLSLTISSLLMLWMEGRKDRRLTHLVIVITVAGVVALVFKDQLVAMLGRGLSVRPKIWSAALSSVEGAWIFGRGFLTPFTAEGYAWIHNGFLATLRAGGLVGLLLLFGLLIEAFWLAYRNFRTGNGFLLGALLVFGVLVQMVDGDQLILRPKEVWLFFWLPMGLALLLQLQALRPRPG